MPRVALCWACVLSVLPALAQSDADSPREVIDALIEQRESAPTISPQTSAAIEPQPNRVGIPAAAVDLDPAVVGVLPGAPLPRLRREGEFVIERPGQLVNVENSSYWVFVFDSVPGEPDLRPMMLQKCQRLASMQDTINQRHHGQSELSFTLTGQVHTYRGVNYLLPTAIAGTRQMPPEVVADMAEAAAQEAESAPSAITLEDPETPATFGGPGSDPVDLMEQMLDATDAPPTRPNTAPIVSAADPTLDEALRGVKPDQAEQDKLRREGEYLVNRAGRLTRGLGGAIGGGADNVLFAFEADGPDPESAEPPMMVMPCKLLELMEDTVAERGDQLVFMISGRVHMYRGANYLLPTTMRLEYDLGNVGN